MIYCLKHWNIQTAESRISKLSRRKHHCLLAILFIYYDIEYVVSSCKWSGWQIIKKILGSWTTYLVKGARNIYFQWDLVKTRMIAATNKWTNEKALRESQTLRAGCSKAETKIFSPPRTPFPAAQDGQNLISWRWLLPLPTDHIWWKSMHAISSYRGNRPTKKHTHTNTHKQTNPQTGPITIYCAAKLSAQCKYRPPVLVGTFIHFNCSRLLPDTGFPN